MARFIPLCYLCLIIPIVAIAGDEATFNFIGFSQNGEYLAFEQFGWYDGSGFPYAEIIFVNVSRNRFACKPVLVVLEEDEWDQSARKRAKENAREWYVKFGIIEGNTGYHVASQSRHETDADPHYVSLSKTDIPLDTLGKYFQYAVRLAEIEVDVTDDLYDEYHQPKMLELSIEAPEIREPFILQRDTELPERRSNVLSYHISDVYLYRYQGTTYIAVFISYMMPGFEGPDFRYMVVTDILP